MITITMRDMLIEHIDGPVPFVARGGPRASCLRAMMRRGFLKFDRSHHPTFTLITDNGRSALAVALADWAEALVRAGSANAKKAMNLNADPPAVDRGTVDADVSRLLGAA